MASVELVHHGSEALPASCVLGPAGAGLARTDLLSGKKSLNKSAKASRPLPGPPSPTAPGAGFPAAEDLVFRGLLGFLSC